MTGGWLMLHPRPPTGNALMKWKNRRPAYRVYVTLNETKLKWFGKDVVAGDEGLSCTSMNTHTRAHTHAHTAKRKYHLFMNTPSQNGQLAHSGSGQQD